MLLSVKCYMLLHLNSKFVTGYFDQLCGEFRSLLGLSVQHLAQEAMRFAPGTDSW